MGPGKQDRYAHPDSRFIKRCQVPAVGVAGLWKPHMGFFQMGCFLSWDCLPSLGPLCVCFAASAVVCSFVVLLELGSFLWDLQCGE